MEGIFTEFENENSLRSYPFAAGCIPADMNGVQIPADVFVDAAIYPVNPSGTVYLSSVSKDGRFSISDDTGVIMTGAASGNVVEFTDVTDLSRHTGTVVASSSDALSGFLGFGDDRSFEKDSTKFSASCVFPVVIDGVVSVDIDDTGMTAGIVGFSNEPTDVVRASSGIRQDGRNTLRFDVIPFLEQDIDYIKRVICVVDGKTPFRIERHQCSYNTVVLRLDGIDKDTVCAAAHRENEYEMADTCDCVIPPSEPPVVPPDTYQIVEVYIPPDKTGEEGGIPEGADNAFYLVVPNLVNYINPISITLEDGVVVPKTKEPDLVIDGNTAELAESATIDEISSKGVIVQVPGLSGGLI